MLKKIVSKAVLVGSFVGSVSHASDSIDWSKGMYQSWSCKILDPSAIHESPHRLDIYIVQQGVEGPRRHYTFPGFVIRVDLEAVPDPVDPWKAPRMRERSVIAFMGTMKKDATVGVNEFSFEAADGQPLSFRWRDGKGELRYQGHTGAIECRYPAWRTTPPTMRSEW